MSKKTQAQADYYCRLHNLELMKSRYQNLSPERKKQYLKQINEHKKRKYHSLTPIERKKYNRMKYLTRWKNRKAKWTDQQWEDYRQKQKHQRKLRYAFGTYTISKELMETYNLFTKLRRMAHETSNSI